MEGLDSWHWVALSCTASTGLKSSRSGTPRSSPPARKTGYVSIWTPEGEAIRTVADTADHPTNPRAEVAFVVESLDAPRLVGQTFIVPHGRTKDYDLASLVEFLDRKHNMFLVRWTGTARDV